MSTPHTEHLHTPGTVMTALRMEWPRYASAVSFILVRVKAPIWLGEYLQRVQSVECQDQLSVLQQPPAL